MEVHQPPSMDKLVEVPQPPIMEETGSLPRHTTPQEMVARAIAPIKPQFRRAPPSSRVSDSFKAGGLATDSKSIRQASGQLTGQKKSKRQLKRERQLEKKSSSNLCPDVRKTGIIGSCSYGEKCHFGHDLEAFMAQKPDDLDGDCPFVTTEGKCPYGFACRFYGTHKEDVDSNMTFVEKRSSEVNGLAKDVQKRLWKNIMKFPKADFALSSLGLMAKCKLNKKHEDADSNVVEEIVISETCDKSMVDLRTEVDTSGESLVDGLPPLKKSKSEEICEKDKSMTITTNSCGETEGIVKLHPREKKIIDFRHKLYLAPLTTVGNLPFRRICKSLGADVTCGEMAMCTNLLQGQASEWALLRRHSSEDLFGVQICGSYPDTVARVVELIDQECRVDFIDVNMGCPIDIVVNKGAGSCLLTKPMRMKGIIQAASATVGTPITVKVRTGYFEGKNRIDSIIADISAWGARAVTIHGRTRQQRYSKLADWDYIHKCARNAPGSLQVLGNGDIFSYVDWNKQLFDNSKLSSCMLARGAIIKPWLFTEIKEQRHWDISSGERLDILKDYVRFGLEHWGSDSKGVETTRHFLLEWLSYLYRYVPIELLEIIPQQLNWRPPSYFGRNDLETLMSSDSAADWVRISEMLLGKVPDGFTFTPKHKSNAYESAENG